MAVIRILFGAAFTIGASMALGAMLLRRMRLKLHRTEAALFAFLSGSAALSLLAFALCLVQQAKAGVFLALGLAAIATWGWGALTGARRTSTRVDARPLSPLPQPWWLLFAVVFLAFFTCYLINAMAPEVSPDGSGYHLGNVARYWRHGGFAWDYHSIYASMPQGMEMLFLVAFCFGRHSAAAMVHAAFQTVLPLLVLCYGRRFAMPRAGAFAAIIIYACPVIGIAGISAYNDVAVATLLFAVFYLLQVWDEERSDNLLILSGLMCGFAVGVKYTSAAILPLALAFVVWRGARWTRNILRFVLSASLMAAPWLIRNWIWLGDPVAPFLNAVFPNPFWSATSEKAYLAGLAHYPGSPGAWEILRQVTAVGGLVPGMLGPVFLLAPVALLALRTSQGRRLLLAALIVSVPAFFNTEVRFLIPAVPLVALAMGMALANSWGALPALAVFHAFISWPSVLDIYADRNAWHLRDLPLRAALRIEPESQYIQDHIGNYALKSAIERAVSPGEKIFSLAGRPAAYLDRDIIVGYESSFGERLQNLLGQGNAAALKGQGIGFLLMDDSDSINPHGVKPIAKANETTFYRID